MLVGCSWYKLWYIAFRTFGASNFYFLKKFLKSWISFVATSFGKVIAILGEEQEWDGKICLPKAEGGLGLKDILSWNKACMIQHIWQIFSKAGTMWIAWIYAYMLKGGVYGRPQLHRTTIGTRGKYSNLEVWPGSLWRWRMGRRYRNWQELNFP